MSKKKIDKLCDYMRNLHKDYLIDISKRTNDIDKIVALQSRIILLELLLQEAAFIKKEKSRNEENVIELEDVGC